ncbi:hypothetical protein BZG36_01118 [Bifiguratus adelaidae]|uniref:SWI5-dependent HO expression protein 3 n=1 Tax=Bifiguratus adelaidae TaxID=1938954 RepID=A0A261Y639_9FUNG|nr:hypothetical protein BZG36_01118 [Bifiguratus adelaidae]
MSEDESHSGNDANTSTAETARQATRPPMARRNGSSDVEELQNRLAAAQQELARLKAQLDATREAAKTAEQQALESAQTNRKLKLELQTLTDMTQRKDRQVENSKATAFFFEGQLKKYREEIASAKAGIERLQTLEEQVDKAKQAAEETKDRAAQEYKAMKKRIEELQQQHLEQLSRISTRATEAEADYVHKVDDALEETKKVQREVATETEETISELNNIKQESQALKQQEQEFCQSLLDLLTEKKNKLANASEDKAATMLQQLQSDIERLMRSLRL